MTILRSGPSKGYSGNWAKAFGKPKKTTKAKATSTAKKKKAKKAKPNKKK